MSGQYIGDSHESNRKVQGSSLNKSIKQHVDGKAFKFSHVNPTEFMKQIDLLDSKKSSSRDIPTDILKGTKELICPYLTDYINSAIYDCKFPDEMKTAKLIPAYKNDD